MSFKSHLDMISLNEPITHKARFWQSYVRALKGTDDMRADDSKYTNPRSRAMSEFPEFFYKTLGDERGESPQHRIFAPGYRYLPVSRETYGYTPRNIYGYDRPSTGGGYRPRASSVPPPSSMDNPNWLGDLRASSPAPYFPKYYPLSHYETKPWSERERSRERSPTPYNNPPSYYRPINDMLNPNPLVPISRFTRDPWWYDLCHPASYTPMSYYPRHMTTYPSALRNSYLSPVRNSYLWSRHPLRYL